MSHVSHGWMYAGTSIRKLRGARNYNQRRPTPERTPALRLASVTRREQSSISVAETAQPGTIRLTAITQRSRQPFAARTTGCPHLEARQANRRCLAATAPPIDLDHQVRYCLTGDHNSCSLYPAPVRSSRRHTVIPVIYMVGIVISLILLLLAGLSFDHNPDDLSAGALFERPATTR